MMLLFKKIIRRIKIETRFLAEQKWGLTKPEDPFTIPKYNLKKYLPCNPVIIDCGAHTGADSIELAKIFPRAAIHAFEPIPEIFAQLKHTTRRYKNIMCYQLALGNSNSNAKMHVSSGSSDASSSLLPPAAHIEDHPGVLFQKTVEVKTVTLDSWAVENNIAHVDFLWLDMQGFEFQALQASEKILSGVKAVHTEVSLREAYENSVLYPQFKQWLTQKGFKEVATAIPPGADMGNALFVKQ